MAIVRRKISHASNGIRNPVPYSPNPFTATSELALLGSTKKD
jgi:hypothetical protein